MSSSSRLNFGRQLSPGSGNMSVTIARSAYGLRADARCLADKGFRDQDLPVRRRAANVWPRYGEWKLGANLA
jgi:hypothetical protein